MIYSFEFFSHVNSLYANLPCKSASHFVSHCFEIYPLQLMWKDKPKKKKRTMLCPILGATLKFHKDDDMDPAAAGAVGAAA